MPKSLIQVQALAMPYPVRKNYAVVAESHQVGLWGVLVIGAHQIRSDAGHAYLGKHQVGSRYVCRIHIKPVKIWCITSPY